ncbi:3-octaprenyl-4-hydroxybenzoate decarboxylase, partial [mine drainage metagenome]
MAFHDLRAFLAHLQARHSLRRVAQPIDPQLESTAFCLRALRAGGPALLFEHARGSVHPMLGNLFGHRERIEAALAGRPLA